MPPKKNIKRKNPKRRFRKIAKVKPSVSSLTIHRHKRFYQLQEFVATTSGPQTYVFRLNQLPNFAEYSALYDQYRLDKWVVNIYYAGSNNNTHGTLGQSVETGLIGAAYDYTDSIDATSLNELREYETYRERQLILCHPWTITFVPKVSMMTYRTVSTTGYTIPKVNPFIACTDSDVPHFCLKTFYQVPPSNTMEVTVTATAYLSFRSGK